MNHFNTFESITELVNIGIVLQLARFLEVHNSELLGHSILNKYGYKEQYGARNIS